MGSVFTRPSSLTDEKKLQVWSSEYEGYRKSKFPLVKEITAADLLHKQQEQTPTESFIVVDCRDEAEQKVSIIPGAITKPEFEALLEKDNEAVQSQEVVAYCTIGYRSGLYVKQLEDRGIAAANLKGSILAWTHEGGELVDAGGQSTTKVHTYGRRWALAASGYTSVWYRSMGWT
jgi:sodium/bile acid cotransporter 7